MRSRPTLRCAALFASLAAPVCLPALASAQVIEYYHTDLVGNVRAVTDEQRNVIERHDYLPFGEECTTGACAANPAVGAGQPRKFTGKERDSETGLDYFGARYYGSKIGRFTTTDPVIDQGAALVNPQLWNRYAYGRNNPLRYVDPDGRASMLTADSMRAMAANMEANNAAIGKALVNTIRAINSPGHMTAEKARAYYEQPDSPDQALRMDVADLLLTLGLAATVVRSEGGAPPPADVPPFIYRAGGTNPGNLTPRPGEAALSFRDSLSNPYPLSPGEQPVFRAGQPYIKVDTSRLPAGSVARDNVPPGHVSVRGVPAAQVKDAVVEKGKLPN
jgi:RHS repeat-associated protein